MPLYLQYRPHSSSSIPNSTSGARFRSFNCPNRFGSSAAIPRYSTIFLPPLAVGPSKNLVLRCWHHVPLFVKLTGNPLMLSTLNQGLCMKTRLPGFLRSV